MAEICSNVPKHLPTLKGTMSKPSSDEYMMLEGVPFNELVISN